MEFFAAQMKQVFRRLLRAPMFAFIAILTLALGIGANTAIFSVLDGVLLKPLPYPDPDRLIGVWHNAPGVNIQDLNMSPSLYFAYKDQSRTFQSLGVYYNYRVTVTGLAEPERVQSLVVTADVLPTLGVQPALGRAFSQQDDSPGSPETVILSYAYWQRRFGGSQNVLGRNIRIDGKQNQIIGVMPRDFRFLDLDAMLFRPFQLDRGKTVLGNFSYEGVARLKPGVTLAQANADGFRILPIANRMFPAPAGFSAKMLEQARIKPDFRPFKHDLTGDIGPMLWVLMGTIGVVLLIACANVANLLLVRVEGRHMELAIRSALGARARRIAGEMLFESLTVAIFGGLAGLALAFGALRLLVAIAPAGLPRVEEIGIDAPVLLFALAVSLFTGLLFGSIPIFKYIGNHLNSSLREGGRSISQSRERHRARNTLVVVQVALALVLLISSGLMIRTFQAMTQVNPGFTGADRLQTLSISIPDAQVPSAEKVLRMEQDIADHVKQIPGVESVALTTAVPMGGNQSSDLLFARDHTYREGQLPPIRRFVFISPGLHGTLGTPLIAGRDLTWADNENKSLVCLISESLARDQWGSPQAAMHKQVRQGMNDAWREVVGVVGDVHADGVDKPAPASIYYPLLMDNFQGDKDSIHRFVTYVIRTPRAGSENFLREVRQAIWSVDANLPLASVRTLDQMYRQSMARTSFTLVMLMISAGMALLLGGVGIYGVIAYSVAQRTREIGIRMALGAERAEVAGMFVRHGITLAAIGSAFGLLAAVMVTRLLSSLLFAVSPADPVTYAAMLVLLLAIAALASYIPSRRAASVDPSIALRLE
jgi:predicted permease